MCYCKELAKNLQNSIFKNRPAPICSYCRDEMIKVLDQTRDALFEKAEEDGPFIIGFRSWETVKFPAQNSTDEEGNFLDLSKETPSWSKEYV